MIESLAPGKCSPAGTFGQLHRPRRGAVARHRHRTNRTSSSSSSGNSGYASAVSHTTVSAVAADEQSAELLGCRSRCAPDLARGRHRRRAWAAAGAIPAAAARRPSCLLRQRTSLCLRPSSGPFRSSSGSRAGAGSRSRSAPAHAPAVRAPDRRRSRRPPAGSSGPATKSNPSPPTSATILPSSSATSAGVPTGSTACACAATSRRVRRGSPRRAASELWWPLVSNVAASSFNGVSTS